MNKKLQTILVGFFLGSFVWANPNPADGTFISGLGTIGINGSSKNLIITQSTNTAIIDWTNFSISAGELTQFKQPGTNSAVLNRVIGGNLSDIEGTLKATGQVYLINQNGILIGSTGSVISTGFVASTRDIADNDFLAGHLHFTGVNGNGVQNLGKITVTGGSAILIGKTVDNEGTVSASNNTVGLVAGDDVLLGQTNTDGSTIVVNATSSATPNAGTAVTNGGRIIALNSELKAANGNVYALAINNLGTISATSTKKSPGHIYLTADGGVINSGYLRQNAYTGINISGAASEINVNGAVSGSYINIRGQTIHTFSSAPILAPGGISLNVTGGDLTINNSLSEGYDGTGKLLLQATGSVNINNALTVPRGFLSIKGSSINFNISNPIVAALGTTLDAAGGDLILNNALSVGKTGTGVITLGATGAVMINNSLTVPNGAISIVGAAITFNPAFNTSLTAGNGISLEATTGDLTVLNALSVGLGSIVLKADQGGVFINNRLSATNGALSITGTTLNFSSNYNATLTAGNGIFLEATNSDLTINNALSTSAGQIFLSASGIVTLNNTLTTNSGSIFIQGTAINLNNSITSSGTLMLNASGNINPGNTAAISVGGFILQNGSWLEVVGQNGLTALPLFSAPNDFELRNNSKFLRVAGGDGSGVNPYQLTDVYGLQGVSGYTTSNIVLNNNIDATSTGNWNGGLGFNPLGNDTGVFKGTFNGQNFSINGLTINNSTLVYTGLFGNVNGANLQNLRLTGVNITGGEFVGSLVGYASSTTINNCLATGAVRNTGTSKTYDVNIGGLVGSATVNTNISNAYAGVDVISSNTCFAGGLVGFADTSILFKCYATGMVTGLDDLGGLLGHAQSAVTIQNCYATGNVIGGSKSVGGLVGYTANNTKVFDCYETGSVTSAAINVGGLIGHSDASSFSKCYATGNVSDSATTFATRVGGLMGFENGGTTIANCYSIGSVTGAGNNSTLGGLVGLSTTSTTTSCYWLQQGTVNAGLTGTGLYINASGVVSIGDNVGAALKTLAQLQQQSTYVGYNFTPVTGAWAISPNLNGGLAYLQAIPPAQ